MERDNGPETRIYNAAARGDERALEELLQNDPLLLDRVSYTCSNKSPLHVATIHGHTSVVQIILNHNPYLAQELDSHQSSALHIASYEGYLGIAIVLLSAAPDMCLSLDWQGRNPLHLAAMKGHVDVLKELLQVYPMPAPDMCLSRDCQGRIPLHLAAMNGHVDVLEKLIHEYPMAAQMKLDRGMTVLHLCVMYRQTETFKRLVQNFDEMVNAKDDNGETVLHMAVRDRQIQTIDFLLTVAPLEVNGLNLNGMTALDVLIRSRRDDARDSEIEESLKRAMAANNNADLKQNNSNQDDAWLERQRGALMVAASLIATMAFQVGVNPPGGVWQDDETPDSTDISGKSDHWAGFSILARNYPHNYTKLYRANTVAFAASLIILQLLMIGLPLRNRFAVLFLMMFTCIAITSMALVYIESVQFLAPAQISSLNFSCDG